MSMTYQSRMQAMPFLFTQHATVASARGGYIRLNLETKQRNNMVFDILSLKISDGKSPMSSIFVGCYGIVVGGRLTT
jgi:hypothetical protein